MEEVEIQGSTEITTPQTEFTQDAVSAQETTQQASQDTGWIKQLRRDREDSIKREKETAQKLKMQEEILTRLLAQQGSPVQAAPQEEDILSQIEREEYVPGDKVAKTIRKLTSDFDARLKEMDQKYNQKKVVDRFDKLREKFPDLDDVVNSDTLAIVAKKDPLMAETWIGLDDYAVSVNAYRYIKAHGILDEVPGAKRVEQVEKKLAATKAPPPLDALKARPMEQAFGKSAKEAQQKLYQEMTHYASQGGGY